MPDSLNVFVSYSRRDTKWLDELQLHLKPLVRDGQINLWDDTRIDKGKRWKEEIRQALEVAHVAILLVSKHFLASDFINTEELPPLLKAADEKGVVILPLIIGHCRFQQTKSLSVFQAVNNPGKPLASIRSPAKRDEEFVRLTDHVEAAWKDRQQQREKAPPAETSEVSSGEEPAPPEVVKDTSPVASKPPPRASTSVALPPMWENALGMRFVLIPAGTFRMGSEKGGGNENPVHRVRISKPFYLGVHVVTQGQWSRVMGTQPWKEKEYVQEGEDYPAVYVSWEDAQAFIKKLNAGDDESRYRLPREAEWEYACRAESTTEYCFGDDALTLKAYAWYDENAWDVGEQYAHRVVQKRPNAWGLYDMHGNVWEWVADRYGSDYYKGSPEVDPQGPETGSFRVCRGGGWYGTAGYARSASRSLGAPDYRVFDLGFRLVRMAL